MSQMKFNREFVAGLRGKRIDYEITDWENLLRHMYLPALPRAPRRHTCEVSDFSVKRMSDAGLDRESRFLIEARGGAIKSTENQNSQIHCGGIANTENIDT